MSLKYVNIGSNEGARKTTLPKSSANKKKKIIIRLLIGLGVFILILGILGAVSYPGVKAFTNQLNTTKIQAKKVSETLQNQDIEKTKTEVLKLKNELTKLDSKLSYFSWTNPIPFLGGYYRDGHHFIKAGLYGSDAGVIICDSLIPFADALGLKGGGAGNAELYAQHAVEAMPKILPSLDDIEAKLKLVRKEIDQVNTSKYPVKIGSYSVRPVMENAKTTVDNIEAFMPEIRPILTSLPNALGSPVDKTYLILFQNDKELRSTGGFITAYATAKISKGKLASITSEDAYRLDDRVRSRPALPNQLRDYLKVNKFFIRDANVSPDFPTSMRIFEGMYDTASGVQPIDGIIALDTEFVRAMLEVVGDVQIPAYSVTFSSKIDPNYGIPDVVYKLELYSEQLLQGKENRKDLIGQLMNALVHKVLGSDKKQWFPLLQQVQKMADQKHILAYSHDKSSQVLLEKYNYGGLIKNYDADYLAFNSNNFAGLKGDAFVTQKIDQEITIAADGTVTKKVTFTNTNPSKISVGWLNPTVYTNWLRLYVPEGSKLVGGNFNNSIELGKQMYQTVLKTTLGNSSSVTFTYELPLKIKKGDEYRLLIQKQPGTGAPEVNIKVNGKQKDKFLLDTDREIKFKV